MGGPRASRRVEEGLSRSFSGHCIKPRVPLTCACDLRELLRVGHDLSELSTMTRLSWVALHGMAHSFIELDKAVVHVIRLISFL